MASYLQRNGKVSGLVLLCAGVQVQASPTPPGPQSLKATPYLVTILIVVTSLVLLFIVKCIFVSIRRWKRNTSRASGLSAKSPHIWRDDLSISSLNAHPDTDDVTEQGGKSAFLVGLLGSPSWETRPFATLDVSFNPLNALIFDKAFYPGILTPHAPAGRNCKRYKLFSGSTSRWHSRERSPQDHQVPAMGKKLMAIPFTIFRGKSACQNAPSKPDSPLIVHYSDSSALHRPLSEGLHPGRVPQPAALKALSSSIASPEPALVLPCPANPVSSLIPLEAQAGPSLHTDLINHTLFCSSQKHIQKETGSPPSHHPILLASSISLPAMPCKLNTLSQQLSDSNLYFRTNRHPYALPVTRTSASSPRQQVYSPILRPSPLRNMYVPTDDDFVESFEDLIADAEEDDRVRLLASSPPGDFLGSVQNLVSPTTGEFSKSPPRSLTKTTDHPDNLVTFLEELVQATSGWDDSLFLDSNFRAMIDSSKPASPSPPAFMIKPYRPARKRRTSFVFLEDIPEVDVTDCEILNEEVEAELTVHVNP